MGFAAGVTGGIAQRRRPVVVLEVALAVVEHESKWVRVLALITGAGSDATRRAARWRYAASDRRTLASHVSEPDGTETAPGTYTDQRRDADSRQREDPEFDAFYLRHEQPLYGYLRRMLPAHEIAVDVAQEAFFRAWIHFAEVRAYERPEAWLYRVATNLTISHLRRRSPLSFAQVFRHAGADVEDGTGGAGGEEETLADPLDMEGDVAARDLINRALSCLPERQRAALLLRAVHGFSGEEIAGILDISVANARQILSRGREHFRQLYEEAVREGGEAV